MTPFDQKIEFHANIHLKVDQHNVHEKNKSQEMKDIRCFKVQNNQRRMFLHRRDTDWLGCLEETVNG